MTPLPLRAKLGRYVLTAGAAAVVDLGGFAILARSGVPVLPAALASFLAANVVNYVLSARFAFTTVATWRRYPLFLASSGIGLAVNVAVTTAAAGMLGLAPVAAKVAGIGTAFLINFTLNAVVVFAK